VGSLAVSFEIENDAKSCCKVMNGRWFDGRQIEAFVFSPINENSIQQQDIDSFLAGIMQDVHETKEPSSIEAKVDNDSIDIDDFLAGIMQEERQAQTSSTVEPISVYTSAEAKVDDDSNDNLDIDSFLEGIKQEASL